MVPSLARHAREDTGPVGRGPVGDLFGDVEMGEAWDEMFAAPDAEGARRAAAAISRHWDDWGTLVHAFELHADAELTVVGTSTVEIAMSPPCTGE